MSADDFGIPLSIGLPRPFDENDSWAASSELLPSGGMQGSGPNGEQILQENLEEIKLLGRGASGTVHLVQDTTTDELYALKDIQLSMEKETRRQVMNELLINHKVKSPYVVRCYQSFSCDGHIKIVLQYMDGGSLADVLKRRQSIEEEFIAGIARQALLGFRDLQKQKIIHRDIKPSNLLIDSAGNVKISDFGVSRALENSADVGKTFAGTYTYMSPERIEGGKHSYNTDIWAFGLTMLECAIGKYPYDPPPGQSVWNNYFDLLSKIQHSPAPTPSPSRFSSEFCSFISACLQKDPENRKSAGELLKHPFLNLHSSVDLTELVPPEY